jgi:hypothetical protein
VSSAPATVSWITLFAGLGIGSIVSAMVGWWSAKAVAISNHRQNWINALRDDLVSFLKEVDVLRFRVPKMLRDGDPADVEKQQDARNAAMMAYRRVLMRLNITERLHVNLATELFTLMTVHAADVDEPQIDAVVNASREVLKYEWAVAKYGLFLRWMAP